MNIFVYNIYQASIFWSNAMRRQHWSSVKILWYFASYTKTLFVKFKYQKLKSKPLTFCGIIRKTFFAKPSQSAIYMDDLRKVWPKFGGLCIGFCTFLAWGGSQLLRLIYADGAAFVVKNTTSTTCCSSNPPTQPMGSDSFSFAQRPMRRLLVYAWKTLNWLYIARPMPYTS